MSIESAMNLNKYLGGHVKNGGRIYLIGRRMLWEMVDVYGMVMSTSVTID